MTEKRFTISGVGISDHEKKRLYDLQTIDGFISVRDELNVLHEENQRLRQYEKNTKEIIETILTIATKNGVIGKTELLKVINDD